MIFKGSTILIAFVFSISIAFGQVFNDVCIDNVLKFADGSCDTYCTDGATNSGNPTAGLNCGFDNEGFGDVWFRSVVPSSGNISAETFIPATGGITDVDMEIYTGDCTNLEILACNSRKNQFGTVDRHAKIELEGLTQGSTIYIRIIAPNGQSGDFDLCVNDMGYSGPCQILHVELGAQTACDPVTNSYDQEFIVHYRSDGTATAIGLLDFVFDLEPSPQTITLENLPANGTIIDLNVLLYDAIFAFTECSANSTYRGDDFYQAPSNCFSGVVANDECSSATLLTVGSECFDLIGDNTGATPSLGVGEFDCYDSGDYTQDVWYQFVVPISGDVVVNTYVIGPEPNFEPVVDMIFEVYEGLCGTLNKLTSCAGGYNRSVRLTGLTPGVQLFVRLADNRGDKQGEFGICVFEAESFTNDNCDSAIEIMTSGEDSELIYTTHGATAEGNPTSSISCTFGGSSPTEDVWFKIITPIGGSLILSLTEEELGQTTALLEIFTGTCGSLVFKDCVSLSLESELDYVVMELIEGEDVFIRIAEVLNRPMSFGFNALKLENDLCNDAIMLLPGECQTYTNERATASMNPTPGVTCDGASPAVDTWFKTIVPAEGLLRIYTDQVSGGLTSTVIEAYSGNCSSLSLLDCNLFSGPGSHAQLQFVDLPVGDTIYFRISDRGSNNIGEFQVCHTFLDKTSCFIDSLIFLGQTCDPTSNTFSQELEIHYQADQSASHLRLSLSRVFITEEIALTGSPMRVVIDSIFASGLSLDYQAQLFSDTEANLCLTLANLTVTNESHAPCFNLAVQNDECVNAIPLEINSFCEFQVFDNTGATASHHDIAEEWSCDILFDEAVPDVWFKFTQPNSDLLSLEINFIESFPLVELYSGNCNNLEFLGCDLQEIDFQPGVIYFIRAFDGGRGVSQGQFGICLTSYCPDEEDITEDLNGIFRFQDHISITAENTIESGSEVIYDAGSFIEMTSGFEVETGAELDAFIDGCQDETVECLIEDNKFTGFYELSYIGDATAGFGIPFDTTEAVELLSFNPFNNLRSVGLQQLPQFGGFLNVVQFDFDCDNVIMFESGPGVGCSGGTPISVIGAHIDGFNIDSPYDINDDSEFIVNFIDYFDDGGCGVSPTVKTMKFTKVSQ